VLVAGRGRVVTIDEALLGALLGDAERGADLGPRAAGLARRRDEVPEEQVALVGDLARDLRRDGDAGERVAVGAAVVDGLDELVQ
jgi:hypothetical protein